MPRVGPILSLQASAIGIPRTRFLLLPVAFAAGILVFDLAYAPTVGPGLRLGLAAAFVLLSLATSRPFTCSSFGLTLIPVQGWRPWRWAIFVLVMALSLVCLALYASARFAGNPLSFRSMFTSHREVLPHMVVACITAPLMEEAVYRIVVCTAVRSALGPWAAVVVSGLAFAFLHVRYGNPSVDNALAGFFFAWVFLKSGSVVPAVVFHLLGNAVIVLMHAALIDIP